MKMETFAVVMITAILGMLLAGFAISTLLHSFFSYDGRHDPEQSFDLLVPPDQTMLKNWKEEKEELLNISSKVA